MNFFAKDKSCAVTDDATPIVFFHLSSMPLYIPWQMVRYGILITPNKCLTLSYLVLPYYRRIKLPCRKVLDKIYFRRAKKCIEKIMKVQWAKEMDIDSLEAEGNWASIEEMLASSSPSLSK